MTDLRRRVILLYDRSYPDLGGMERMIAEVAAELTRTHDVIIMAERRKGRSRYEQVKGLSVLRYRSWERAEIREALAGSALVLGFGYTPYSFRAIFTLAAGAQALKAGVPLAWCPTYYPIPRSQGARSRLGPLPLLKAIRGKCRAALDRKYLTLFQQCQTLFALTGRERLHWERECIGVPVQVVPHGVSGNHTECVDRRSARGALEDRYGPGLHIVAIGRITPQKNQKVVVRALPALKRRVPGVRLLIVGPSEGPEEAHLRKLAKALDCSETVTLTGRVTETELCQLYAGAICVVHPSRYEASGLVPLEALTHGTPVIHSGRGALERYAALPGARLVSAPDEPSDWARAIEDTLADLSYWNRQATLGRRVVLKEHTWEGMAAEIARVADFRPGSFAPTGNASGLSEPALEGASRGVH
jgi:glycosyltransferase involved in cell wall biosynthesis